MPGQIALALCVYDGYGEEDKGEDADEGFCPRWNVFLLLNSGCELNDLRDGVCMVNVG